MKHRASIRGVMIPNDYKWYYNLFKEDSTCPRDIESVLEKVAIGDEVEIDINSPGGVIDVGSEIYTMIREAAKTTPIKMKITGQACSAASIAAIAAYCEMSPTALMMVHCVSSAVRGNHADMEHMSEVLRTADEALCRAYMHKAGMTEDEALDMMEHETWLTAEQAKEKKLIDAVMFEEKETQTLVNGINFELPTKEMLEQAKKIMKEENPENTDSFLYTRINFLKLKGESR